MAIEKIKHGDTADVAVGKVNACVEQTNANAEAIDDLKDAVATAGGVNDVKVNGGSVVTNKVANIEIPTKVSELDNDSGFLDPSYIGANHGVAGLDENGYVTPSQLPLGSAGGIATLDETGKVPSSQLPSYVDDVLEYASKSSFPLIGETGKIYVDKSENKTYRWSGSQYTAIVSDISLGETSSTAYAGDKGKAVADKVNNLEKVAVVADNATTFANDAVIVGSGEGKKVKASGYSIVNAPIGNDITLPAGADKQVLDRESTEYGIRESMLHMMPLMIFKKGKYYGESHEDYNKLVFKCTENGVDEVTGQLGTTSYYFNLFKRGFAPILVFGKNYSTLVTQIEWSQSSSEYTIKLPIDNTLQSTETVEYGFVMLAKSTALFNSVIHPDAETIK